MSHKSIWLTIFKCYPEQKQLLFIPILKILNHIVTETKKAKSGRPVYKNFSHPLLLSKYYSLSCPFHKRKDLSRFITIKIPFLDFDKKKNNRGYDMK